MIWFGDGTFKVVPEIFYQLYTIHCLTVNGVIPCVYALLPNKQRQTYLTLFRRLLALNPRLNPRSFLIDYEQAARSAIEEVFPQVSLKGCFYHLSQSIYRKVQEEGLQVPYQSDDHLALKIRMLAGLAFVPMHRVVDDFETLLQDFPSQATPIADYFEDTYIGRPTQGQNRRAPRYAISMWNMHDRVADDLPRTNNALEGWHNHMQSNVSSMHPNIWKFLDVLKREQALNQVNVNQMLAGYPQPPKRKRYQDSSRIKTIVEDYENRSTMDFLRGIAHNPQF